MPPGTLFAIVEMAGSEPTAHYVGMPAALGHSGGDQDPIRLAEIVFLVEENAGCYLLRYRRDGSFVGDTWHRTFSEAIEQAENEFRFTAEGWQRAPEDDTDLSELSKRVT